MQFDFIGMQNMYLALARQDAAPLIKALQQRPGSGPHAASGPPSSAITTSSPWTS